MEKLEAKSNATVPPFQSNHKRATCLWQKQTTLLKSIKNYTRKTISFNFYGWKIKKIKTGQNFITVVPNHSHMK